MSDQLSGYLFPLRASQRMQAAVSATVVHLGHRLREDQRGEGVISTAIAVLIMAFIGAAAFGLFKVIMTKAADTTTRCLDAFNSSGDNVICGG